MKYLNTKTRKEYLIIPCLFKWLFDCTFDKSEMPEDSKVHYESVLAYMARLVDGLNDKERIYYMRSATNITTTIAKYCRKEKFKTPKCWMVTLEIGRALHHAGWIDLLQDPDFAAAFNFIDDMFANEGHLHLDHIEKLHDSAIKHGNKIMAILNRFGLYKN